jgi:hypothetical protein
MITALLDHDRSTFGLAPYIFHPIARLGTTGTGTAWLAKALLATTTKFTVAEFWWGLMLGWAFHTWTINAHLGSGGLRITFRLPCELRLVN